MQSRKELKQEIENLTKHLLLEKQRSNLLERKILKYEKILNSLDERNK